MMKISGLLILTLLLLAACAEQNKHDAVTGAIKAPALSEFHNPVLNTADWPGVCIGVCFDKMEMYLNEPCAAKDFFTLKIVSLDTGIVTRTIQLPRGEENSPTHYYSPSFVQFLDHHYYIIDQYHKILVYDENFTWKYSSMFLLLRRSINFFLNGNQVAFMATQSIPAKNAFQININLYSLENGSKPLYEDNLDAIVIHHVGHLDAESGGKKTHKGSIWANADAIEKDLKIYWWNSSTDKLHIHDLQKKHTTLYRLAFLKPTKYKEDTAQAFGYAQSTGWEEKYRKMTGRKVIYKAYPEPLYHFGVFDVGKNMIGVAGAVDFHTFFFRLDIIDTGTLTYVKSIWLPFGGGFRAGMSTEPRAALVKNWLDVQRGIYIWHDDGVDPDIIAHITRLSPIRRAP